MGARLRIAIDLVAASPERRDQLGTDRCDSCFNGRKRAEPGQSHEKTIVIAFRVERLRKDSQAYVSCSPGSPSLSGSALAPGSPRSTLDSACWSRRAVPPLKRMRSTS